MLRPPSVDPSPADMLLTASNQDALWGGQLLLSGICFDEDKGVCLQFASLTPSGALKSELEALGVGELGSSVWGDVQI